MELVKIINEYPTVFRPVEGKEYTEDEAIRLISSALSEGSKAQKTSFDIHDGYNAVSKLLKLGLRSTAIPLAEKLLKKASWHQHYSVCKDICNELVYHFYLSQDLESAEKYDVMHAHYSELVNVEYRIQKIYCELIYKDETGLYVDHQGVLSSLKDLEVRYDSCKYRYYYYQCKLMLSKDSDYESTCNRALDYFENLYFKHTTYISIFRYKKLCYHRDNNNFEIVEILVDEYLKDEVEGSLSWFRYNQVKALCFLQQSDKRVKDVLELVFNHSMYQGILEDKKKEWELIAEEASPIFNSVIIDDAEGF